MSRYVALVFVGLLGLAGCASTQYDQGKKLLAQEDYAGAVKALQAAREKEPEKVSILVDLAEALYHQGELDQARVHLEKARSLDPQNSEAVAILGLIHERRGELEAAIAAYRSYSQMSRLGKGRKLIKARLDRLIREKIQQDIQKALAQEAALEVEAIPEGTVAVAPFRNLGGNHSLDPLQKGLAEMMVTDLSKVPGLQVVERLRMQEMMKEIGLAQAGAVDLRTAPRLGRLLGASRIVSGSFADLTEEQVRLDLSIAGTKTEKVEQAGVSGPLGRLFRLQKELTFGVVEELGIKLTEEQRDAIQEIPTENMLAFIAYAKGLDLEDQGKAQEAVAAFQEALSLDPDFGAAQEGLERVEEAGLGTVEIQAVEEEVFAEEEEEVPAEGGKEGFATEEEEVSETQERLIATGMLTGTGFIPPSEEAGGEGGTSERREAAEEQEEAEAGTEIEVVVPLPQAGSIEVTGRFEE